MSRERRLSGFFPPVQMEQNPVVSDTVDRKKLPVSDNISPVEEKDSSPTTFVDNNTVEALVRLFDIDKEVDPNLEGKFNTEEERQRALLHEYWHDDMDNQMQQGTAGNCFAVVALWCMKRCLDGQEMLLAHTTDKKDIYNAPAFQTMFFDDKGSVFGQKGWVGVDVCDDDLKDSPFLQTGSIGDKLFLRAYMRFLHRQRGGSSERTTTFLQGSRGRLVDSGYPRQALHSFLGPSFERFKSKDAQDCVTREEWRHAVILSLQKVFFDRNSGKEESLMVMGYTPDVPISFPPEKSRISFFQKIKALVVPKESKEHNTPSLLDNHAYGIVTVFENNDKRIDVVVIDPYNTAAEIIVPLEEFVDTFCCVEVVRKKPADADNFTYVASMPIDVLHN